MANQLVLQPGTTTKLQNHNLLSSNVDSAGFWTLGVLPFATIFPLITIENGKIPRAFNTVAFLCYLGLEPPIAQHIFSELQNIIEVTEITLTTLAKNYVHYRRSISPLSEAGLVSTVGDLLMAFMGLNGFVRAQVNGLWQRTQQNPSTMDRYLNSTPGRTLASLTLVDYVEEVLDQRMTKMHILDKEVNQHF